MSPTSTTAPITSRTITVHSLVPSGLPQSHSLVTRVYRDTMSCQHLRTFNLFSAYVLSAMRKGFGGHEEIQTE